MGLGGFVRMKRPSAEKLSYFRLLMVLTARIFVIILIRCKFVHFNQNYSKIFANFAEDLPFLQRWGRKTFGIKNRVIRRGPRYNEARYSEV